MIYIPHIKFEAIAQGTQLKGVTCQFCGTQFAFVMHRQASVVSGNSENAESQSQEYLKRQLTQDLDPVPCPVCGRLQDSMPRFTPSGPSRTNVLLRLIILGLILILAGLGAGLYVNSMLGMMLLSTGGGLLFILLMMYFRSQFVFRQEVAPSPPPQIPQQQVWTKKQLEELSAHNPDLDVSDALLDWESQKIP